MARPSLAEKDILRFQKKSPQTGRERKGRWKIKAMLVTQEIGEAGRYEFGFAGKYRGRVSF